MEKRRDVFMAIADPTRREIINMLAHKSLNLNAIADHFDTSRPTISQHVKFLQDCGLITINKQGRERYCEAKFDNLKEVSQWVEQFKQFWTERFNSLDNYLEKIQKNKSDK
ncbi:DNA-binding transcriptional regulator, ArsR family [Reichenbachiella faecimaris]|uniref:DNA-binding transcriptional regulator, ArsR family n=1 Tax=Reichenbachiella faecimaris TaxID=692418 RepID=A0A1W2GM08_REIFA|nr:metalloregulator ArsR/SmtB family transcription factor [Reichenbachiella faecimaris]SMD37689.1 DNA-binding transcriptional regulator, ArsR family [Reichenbachiella faecimaris]